MGRDELELESGGAKVQLLRPWPEPAPERAWRIGLTGGIGCGKTTVQQLFRARGSVVADADQIAREILEPGTSGLQAVAAGFGAGVIHSDGTLDRARLAEIVFRDPVARQRLENITHPRIAERAETVLSQAAPGQIALYDVPLLVERDLAPQFDVVIVVDSDLSLRLERLASRGMSRDQALARIAAQATEAERRNVAHLWIQNDGTLDELTEVVNGLIEVFADRLNDSPT